MARESASDIGEGAAILAVVESLVIRARFAENFQCIRPRFCDPAEMLELRLGQARHPLLGAAAPQGRAATSFQSRFQLTGAERQLIISGPNTGGKTVGLKTTGCVGNHGAVGNSGSSRRKRLFPLLHEILADIGDLQSIEQNLSTFSAHVVNLNRIAEIAGPDVAGAAR